MTYVAAQVADVDRARSTVVTVVGGCTLCALRVGSTVVRAVCTYGALQTCCDFAFSILAFVGCVFALTGLGVTGVYSTAVTIGAAFFYVTA